MSDEKFKQEILNKLDRCASAASNSTFSIAIWLMVLTLCYCQRPLHVHIDNLPSSVAEPKEAK